MSSRSVAFRHALALIALATIGCGGSHGDPTADADAVAPAEPDHPARCRVVAPPTLPRDGDQPVELVARGPDGARYFARRAWGDAAGSGSFELPARGSLAWDGTGYLVADVRGLDAMDPLLATRRVHRVLPPRTCDVQLIATGQPGGAAMVSLRLRRDQSCAVGTGSIQYQRLGPDGAFDGAPVTVGREQHARDVFRAPVVRLDAGRVVIEYDDLTDVNVPSHRFTVLSVDGRELAEGEGTHVACPRAGCVRVLGRDDEGAGRYPDSSNDRLRVVLLGRNTSFSLAASADRVTGLAVSGDRILVRYIEPGAGVHPADALPAFAVLDVVRREMVDVDDPALHGQQVVWRATTTDATPWAIPDGFAITARASAGEPFAVRVLHCQP